MAPLINLRPVNDSNIISQPYFPPVVIPAYSGPLCSDTPHRSKGVLRRHHPAFLQLVGPAGHDPASAWLKARCSAHLNYGPESWWVPRDSNPQCLPGGTRFTVWRRTTNRARTPLNSAPVSPVVARLVSENRSRLRGFISICTHCLR